MRVLAKSVRRIDGENVPDFCKNKAGGLERRCKSRRSVLESARQ
jgi:hypothetical protein